MSELVVRGAREHNLQDVSVILPRHRLVVITGPSGSGKSSLAFDVIFAEAQRRYVEGLGGGARQLYKSLARPDVDFIEGLSPALSVTQREPIRSPRSTVGTLTEISDYLRLLYATLGVPYGPGGEPSVPGRTVAQMVDVTLARPEGTKLSVLAPMLRASRDDASALLERLRREGFVRVRVDGVVHELSEIGRLAAGTSHDLDVVVDRVTVSERSRSRLGEALELALRLAGGRAAILPVDGALESFSETAVVPGYEGVFPALTPALFSFNGSEGACPTCGGLGRLAVEEEPDEPSEEGPVFVDSAPCPSCLGARLRLEARLVRLGGLSLPALMDLTLEQARASIAAMPVPPRDEKVASRVLLEIDRRLGFLIDTGLGYLSLGRSARTLSGGETQRVRLASQLGAGLAGVLYVLDEPTSGLHASDVDRLLATLVGLRDRGNSLLLVEHERRAIERADYLVDMGPGAGRAGGRVVAQGTLAEVLADPGSVTGPFLTGARSVTSPRPRRSPKGPPIRVEGASVHNLRDVTVELPRGVLTAVTGVSGSGKSSLVMNTLLPEAARVIRGASLPPAARSVSGLERFDKLIHIDQAPLGRSSRANAATAIGAMDELRKLFADLPEARVRGYKPSRFSFNVKGGRCEACRGEGELRVDMHFLPDVFIECEVCHGQRFDRETLEVRYRGYSIADVLALPVGEALALFDAFPKLVDRLAPLAQVGLSYLELGRSSTTLSAGEAQRVKLARELRRRRDGQILYVLDEPTRGLHFVDVEALVAALEALVEAGHTVVVVEHHLDVIEAADHIIDLGPGGGPEGGHVLAEGTPDELCARSDNLTGRYLAEARQRRSVAHRSN